MCSCRRCSKECLSMSTILQFFFRKADSTIISCRNGPLFDYLVIFILSLHLYKIIWKEKQVRLPQIIYEGNHTIYEYRILQFREFKTCRYVERCSKKKGEDFSPYLSCFLFIIKKAKFQRYCKYNLNTPARKKIRKFQD